MANISSINGNPIVVGASGISDGAVSNVKLANNAVTTDKIANRAITDSKLSGDGILRDVAGMDELLDYAFDVVYSKNLFNTDDPDVLLNKYLNTNGTLEDLAGRLVTGFMPVVVGKRLVSSYIGGPSGHVLTNYPSCCFYEIDKSTVVAGGAINTNGTIVPAGAAYVRATVYAGYTTNGYSMQFELNDSTQLTDYEPYHEPYISVSDDVTVPLSCVDGLEPVTKYIKNLTAQASVTYGYFTSEVLLYFQQGGNVLVYFRCEPNTTYSIAKTYTNNDFKICYVKNEPATGVEQPVYGYTVLDKSLNNTQYTTGEDALYMLVLFGSGNTHTIEEILADTSITYSDFVYGGEIDDSVMSLMTARDAYLPSKIYMVSNRDYEIYHEQICRNSDQYSFTWSSSGVNLGNRVRFNFTSTGSKNIKCTIRNPDGTIAKELTSTVYVVSPIASDVYLMTFGDSLTNHCVWQAELMNMAENIHCVGSRSRSVNDSDGQSRTVYDEGRAGFTSLQYLNGKNYPSPVSDSSGPEEPNNRWYDPDAGEFSTAYYFANNFPSDQTAPDTVTVLLGMNDILGNNSISDIVVNIGTIVDDMRTYNPSLSVVVMAPQLRYLPTLSNSERAKFISYAIALEEMMEDYTNAVFLPLTFGMDCANNYNEQTVTINTRSTSTEIVASDPTHPAPKGYWQIADYVLGAISYLKA